MKAGSLIGYGVAFLCMMSIGALVFSRFAPNGMAFAGEHASALQRAARIDANYLTTGAVSEQVEAMRLLAPNFNLRMSFASSGSDFGPGDVRVAIQNEHGDAIIDTVADGPLFYANLPSGLYRVTIRANGETLIRIVNLGAGRKASLRFYWPSTQLTLLRGMRG